MQALHDLLSKLFGLVSKALDKIKLGGIAKAVVGAAAPFITIWITTGAVDEKNIIAAIVSAVLVFYVPNLNPAGEPANPADQPANPPA